MTTQVPAAFKFKAWPWVSLGWVGTNIIVITLGVIAIIRNEVGGLLFLLVAGCLFGILGGVAVLSLSEILIDDHAIARRILGVTWQMISWENVRLIRVFRITDLIGSEDLRVFTIYPLKRERPKFGIGKMMFNERSLDITAVLALMNRYVEKYSIPVELKLNGRTTSLPRL